MLIISVLEFIWRCIIYKMSHTVLMIRTVIMELLNRCVIKNGAKIYIYMEMATILKVTNEYNVP